MSTKPPQSFHCPTSQFWKTKSKIVKGPSSLSLSPSPSLSLSLSLSSNLPAVSPPIPAGPDSTRRMEAIRKQATKLREQVARQQQVFLFFFSNRTLTLSRCLDPFLCLSLISLRFEVSTRSFVFCFEFFCSFRIHWLICCVVLVVFVSVAVILKIGIFCNATAGNGGFDSDVDSFVD